MEPWQLALIAAAGGALLLSSGGGGDGGDGGDSGGGGTLPERWREDLYGLPDPPLEVAGEIYGLSESEMVEQLEEYAERLAPAYLRRVTPQTQRAVYNQLVAISALVARIYGPDNSYFGIPGSAEGFTGTVNAQTLNNILGEISRENYHRQQTFQQGVNFMPAAIESAYTTGALEAEWTGYMRTLNEFLRGDAFKGGNIYYAVEHLYLAPGVGNRWSSIERYVTRTQPPSPPNRGGIYIDHPQYFGGFTNLVRGPWQLGPRDPGIPRASSMVANLFALAGEREMATSASALQAGWNGAQGVAKQVLVRKLTNAVVPLITQMKEAGEPLWIFKCDARVSMCPS